MPKEQSVFTATVLVSAPEYGVAFVSVNQGTENLQKTMLAQLPYSDASYGTSLQAGIAAGATVICASDPNSENIAYILTAVSAGVGRSSDTQNWRAYYNVDSFTTRDETTFDAVIERLLGADIAHFRNHAHSVDINALPGDLDITDKKGGTGLHVGRLLTQLRGSALSFIDLSPYRNQIRMLAERIERHTLTSMQMTDEAVSVSDIAVSAGESFGVIDQPAITEKKDAIELTEDSAIPFYRLQHVEGELADGAESIVVIPQEDMELHDSSSEPSIVAKTRRSLTGALSAGSAQCLLSVKTPFITGIHQVGYGCDSVGFDDILTPYTGEAEDDPEVPDVDDELKVTDAAINKIVDTLLSDDYQKVLKEKLMSKGLIIAHADATLQTNRFGEEEAIGGLTSEQEYPLPQKIQVQDPVTGKTVDYYNSTSFISQEPDGSILLCDGYGSEIRMCRGNIYISPAQDLFFRPGRDLSAMVPRHQAYNSQGSCTINTSDAMFIRAIRDLRVAGATSGEGVVTIESDSTKTEKGLQLRSKSSAALVGVNVYVGRNTGATIKKNNITTVSSGSVVIDACSNGVVLTRGAATEIQTQDMTICAEDTASTCSIIRVTPTSTGIYTPVLQAPVQQDMRSLDGACTATVTDQDSAQQATRTASIASEPSIILAGNQLVEKALVCQTTGRVNKGVQALSVVCYSMTDNIKNSGEIFKDLDLGQGSADTTSGLSVLTVVSSLSDSFLQDYYVFQNGFSFPDSYEVTEKLQMPGMVWQVKAGDTLAGDAWVEDYIKDEIGTETACYPGKAVWDASTITQRGYKVDTPLQTGYIMNAVKTTVKVKGE